MKVLGWLIAYWGIWVTLGSFLLMVRFKSWREEWQQVRNEPLSMKLKMTYSYLVTVTLWPREYRDQELMEKRSEDDEDDDDDDEDDWFSYQH